MESQFHKAHRPAQSGAKAEKKSAKAKGKEKQHGFNEKACQQPPSYKSPADMFCFRLLLQDPVGEQKGRAVAQLNATRLASMSPWSTARQMTNLHLLLLLSSARLESERPL